MRTTVDIDSHLLRRLRAEAQRQGIAFKELLQRIIRRGLDASPVGTRRYRGRTFAMGEPRQSIDLDKALTLAATLEDDEVARKFALRK